VPSCDISLCASGKSRAVNYGGKWQVGKNEINFVCKFNAILEGGEMIRFDFKWMTPSTSFQSKTIPSFAWDILYRLSCSVYMYTRVCIDRLYNDFQSYLRVSFYSVLMCARAGSTKGAIAPSCDKFASRNSSWNCFTRSTSGWWNGFCRLYQTSNESRAAQEDSSAALPNKSPANYAQSNKKRWDF
jgi:hypothetical protein